MWVSFVPASGKRANADVSTARDRNKGVASSKNQQIVQIQLN